MVFHSAQWTTVEMGRHLMAEAMDTAIMALRVNSIDYLFNLSYLRVLIVRRH